jgi:DNA-binding NtrC family response regulator
VVLLVEDSELLRQPLEERLTDAGYTVVAASSAEEALAGPADRRIDLLVSDVMMPGLSGAQLAERLRERDPALPVLLISGYTARTVGVLPTDGSYEFLEKPFNLDDFLAKVAQTIRSGG